MKKTLLLIFLGIVLGGASPVFAHVITQEFQVNPPKILGHLYQGEITVSVRYSIPPMERIREGEEHSGPGMSLHGCEINEVYIDDGGWKMGSTLVSNLDGVAEVYLTGGPLHAGREVTPVLLLDSCHNVEIPGLPLPNRIRGQTVVVEANRGDSSAGLAGQEEERAAPGPVLPNVSNNSNFKKPDFKLPDMKKIDLKKPSSLPLPKKR